LEVLFCGRQSKFVHPSSEIFLSHNLSFGDGQKTITFGSELTKVRVSGFMLFTRMITPSPEFFLLAFPFFAPSLVRPLSHPFVDGVFPLFFRIGLSARALAPALCGLLTFIFVCYCCNPNGGPLRFLLSSPARGLTALLARLFFFFRPRNMTPPSWF